MPAPGSYAEALGRMVAQAGWRRVGFEAGHVTVAMLLAWQREATGVEWVNTERLVERLRVVKDDFELATLVRAGRLIDRP